MLPKHDRKLTPCSWRFTPQRLVPLKSLSAVKMSFQIIGGIPCWMVELTSGCFDDPVDNKTDHNSILVQPTEPLLIEGDVFG
jgi:hypothetical protein